jgi:hypothetical protein
MKVKKHIIISFLLVTLFTLSSCKKDEDLRQEKLVVGTWNGSLIGDFIDPITMTYSFSSNNKYSVAGQNNISFIQNLNWKIKNNKLFLQEEKNGKNNCYIIVNLTSKELSFKLEGAKNGEMYRLIKTN